jgi:hypothetical protein
MATENTKIQVNFKTGAGHDAALINVYADDKDDLVAQLDALTEAHAHILAVKQLLQAGQIVSTTLPLAPEQPEQPSATPPAVKLPSAPAPGGVEVLNDRYNNRWTYGLNDAPNLPDGRGTYARKDWTSQQGKVLKAWVDPAKGPKPFPKGENEAELIWIK